MAASCLSLPVDGARLSAVSGRSESTLGRPTALRVAFPALSAAGSCSVEVSRCSARLVSFLLVASRRKVTTNAILSNQSSGLDKQPYVEGIPVGSKLTIVNLPWNCDPQELTQWLRTCGGSVESVEVTNDPESGETRANGLINMGSLDEACAAVAQLDGAKFAGRVVRIDFVERRKPEVTYGNSRSRPSSRNRPSGNYSSGSYSSGSFSTGSMSSGSMSSGSMSGGSLSGGSLSGGSLSGGSMGGGSMSNASPANRVYVGNLPWRMDDAGLEQVFSAHGRVQEAKVMRDRESGRSRGFGFVVMSTSSEMEAAIASLDGSEVEGRLLKVNVAAARDSPRF